MSELSIAIIGAGIGGLSAALALSRQGFDVTVYEKTAELSEVGAGIQLSSNATNILYQWGLMDQAKKIGFLPKAVKLSHWRTGDQIARFPVNHNESFHNQAYLHIHRADIHGLLLQAYEQASGKKVVLGASLHDLSAKDKSQMTITIEQDGQQQTYEHDWVIGADGIHSKVRDFVAPGSQARFTGNVAWRGLVPVESLTSLFRPDPCANLMMGPGAHFVYYYVRGGHFVNYVAVIERDDWQEESWTLKANLKEMLEDFAGWNAQTRNILAHTDPESCYRWALYDRDPISTWCRDRCILLGDAVHPMLPFLAQGAAMAIEDAYQLASCFKEFSQQPEQLKNVYTNARAQRTAKVQLQARKNMQIYHIRNPLIQFPRDQYLAWRGRRDPEFFNKKLAWLYDYRV